MRATNFDGVFVNVVDSYDGVIHQSYLRDKGDQRECNAPRCKQPKHRIGDDALYVHPRYVTTDEDTCVWCKRVGAARDVYDASGLSSDEAAWQAILLEAEKAEWVQDSDEEDCDE